MCLLQILDKNILSRASAVFISSHKWVARTTFNQLLNSFKNWIMTILELAETFITRDQNERSSYYQSCMV